MENHPILKHLDHPIRFLSFEAKDLVFLILPIVLGGVFDSILMFSLIGWSTFFFVKRSLKRFPKFFLMRFLYRKLPTKNFNQLFNLKMLPTHKKMWMK